ncbi:MAG: N(4)-(beta-N-acetylglucosaminyl)-L-asparaginase [Lactobacillaceae bacterium]|jgi:N4-(beta-N-acetylglucosaminyl)-L-asparaginase|nr:N(4)-(beta-N-acetylglucosaminyl)-L-asparaginase [Lactobacillaceae bacterium]
MWGIIATWRMAYEGIQASEEILANGGHIGDAIEQVIKTVEDFPYYKSVGYGGLPNEELQVELDAAFMDGDTLDIGAVAALHNFANPVSIARQLSQEKLNNILVGAGAEKYARQQGFEPKQMLTERAIEYYFKRVNELALADRQSEVQPYRGHDTVGAVGVDQQHTMAAATSTSGLFMKKSGRVGDSPIVGAGFYADSKIGAATATGLGEDLMKGCVSFEIVQMMKRGATPQAACETVVNELEQELLERKGSAGDLSVVAMNQAGEWGCASTINDFSFVVVTENTPLTVLLANRQANKMIFKAASAEWLDTYLATRMAPITQ